MFPDEYSLLDIPSLELFEEMSRIHDGVSCDICLRRNFTGKRFKCLTCPDYDLCETCHDANDPRHPSSHPMQLIFTPHDLMLYFPGVEDPNPSLVCPVCGVLGHTELSLHSHLAANHSEQANKEVICPACALLPIRESAMLVEDLGNHLLSVHAHNRGTVSVISGSIGESISESSHRNGRPNDPLGELLSTLSRRGIQRRPPSAYSLLRPISNSSSGLSLRRGPQIAPQPQPRTTNAEAPEKPPLKAKQEQFLLEGIIRQKPPEAELEHNDHIRAVRSVFTKEFLYSMLLNPMSN